MNLQGKKAVFLGDSITQGHGTTNADTKTYLALLGQMYGMTVKNYGISGTRIARQQNKKEAIDDLDFCTRYLTMDEDADLVVVFGGTNDFGHGDAPFGHFSDRTPDTFYGALHVLMEGLLVRYPTSRIVFLTPLHRHNEDNPCGDNKPAAVEALSAYVAAIRRVAEYYSIPVIDLYATAGIQPRVPLIRQTLCPDGLHPNDQGHVRMAEVIGAALSAL